MVSLLRQQLNDAPWNDAVRQTVELEVPASSTSPTHCRSRRAGLDLIVCPNHCSTQPHLIGDSLLVDTHEKETNRGYDQSVSLDPYRLPTTIQPKHYRLAFEPDLEAETFAGTVSIDATAAEPASEIVLNAEALDIQAASVTVDGTTTTCEVSTDEERQRITLASSGVEFAAGELTIDLTFSGKLNDQLVGPYVSRFTDDDGNDHKLLTTQFEATHARKAFPCWDEPAFKASFEVQLIVEDGLEAISNSPEVDRQSTPEGKIAISFAPTMIMSTYLVAFVAGPLEMTDPVDVDGVPLRIVHTPGKSPELTTFALEAGAFALRYFSDYFGLPYPDQKLDMVAIPDFAFGAMENLGCVTFREVLLLIDPARATQPEVQRAADVINHEIAHMWFGDLVTMKWWNGLWLNEAFATFMEMRCTDAFRPEWERWTDFGLSRTAAFDTDSLGTTRPIEYEVVSPEDAEGMFDILTYEKGAAVVRMLEQYLGEDEFRAGIRRYMNEHKFGNAETTDLWDAIEAETGEPVRRIMDTWIFQGGYPLVTVRGQAESPVLTQSRMRYAGGGDESPDQTWAIPIHYRWQPANDGAPRQDRLLLESDEPTTIALSDPEWFLVNANGSGFLRVAYPDDQLDALAEVATEQLTAVERYSLIDDAWASVLGGEASTLSFLNLLEALTAETNRSVWQRIIGGFSQLRRLTSGEAQEHLEEIAHDAMAPALANLGLSPADDDDDRRRQLRADLIRAIGTIANDREIQQESKRTSAVGLRDPELVDTPLLAAAVDVVAATGDEADFDDFVAAWRKAENPQEEMRYLNALADFPEPELVQRMFQMVLDGEVRSQNAPFLIGRALSNRDCGRYTWQFIVENWDQLNDMFASSLIVRMVSGLTTLDWPEDQVSAADFFAANTVPSGAQTLEQILEKQRVRVALRQRESERLAQFLAR